MASPICEDGGPIREWAPLSSLLQQIPLRIQNGLFTQDIRFTCIDLLPEFIAIGTDRGLVYWYDREKKELQRLRCENANATVTCVRAISSVDFMVAAGTDQGTVSLFQIPKSPPDSLPESLKPKQKKQVERYNVAGLHKKPVTTVEWSKNGMKLFSGDKDGAIVITEIDFYMHLSKSSELLNEKYQVVQLSYHQGTLLVSTVFRTILVDTNKNGKVSQVGQKERKTLSKLGAVFGFNSSHVQEPIVYATRSGLRIWQADKTGKVLKTLIFKDALSNSYTEIELLNPAPQNGQRIRGEQNFGILLPFGDDLLVTFNEETVFVINPSSKAIIAVINELRCVADVACTKDEIFVLEGDRNIVRVAYRPESDTYLPEHENSNDSLSSIVEMGKPVTAGLLELTNKLKESTILLPINGKGLGAASILSPVIAEALQVTKAEEALEMPPILPLELETPLITSVTPDSKKADEQKHRLFEKISEQEFEEVVFAPKNTSKSKKNMSTSVIGPSGSSSSQMMTISLADDRDFGRRNSSRDLEKDVENKERLLADVLSFDLSKYTKKTLANKLSIMQDHDAAPEIHKTAEHSKNCATKVMNAEDEKPHTSYSTENHGSAGVSTIESKPVRRNTKEAYELEVNFNVLSKEYVTSAIMEDIEGWVLL